MVIDLGQQPVPVADAARHHAAVDVVKGLMGQVGPLALDVIDEEPTVWRAPDWLDWTQVSSYNLCVRERLSHFERPVAGAGPEVQDPVRVGGRDGSSVEIAVYEFLPQIMDQVQAILLAFVVGQGVLPLSVRMVSATVLVQIVPDRTREGLA